MWLKTDSATVVHDSAVSTLSALAGDLDYKRLDSPGLCKVDGSPRFYLVVLADWLYRAL